MCKAIEEMRDKFLEVGRKEGREEGEKMGLKTAALRMLEEGKYALEDIARISGFSLTELQALQSSHPA